MNSAVIVDTPEGIAYARLAAMKGAVNLESKGMKMSRGRNITAMARKELGLKARTPHAEVIKVIQQKMDDMLAKRQQEVITQRFNAMVFG